MKYLYKILKNSLKIGVLTVLFLLYVNTIQAQFLDNYSSDTNSIPLEDEKEESIDKKVKTAGVVKSLSAELISNNMNSVKLSWIPTLEKGEYIIARSSVPISNISILLSADSVGVYPSSENFALDSGLPPGAYYYAVVLRKYIKKKAVVLIPGDNYTTKAIVFKTKKITISSTIPPPISLLITSLIKKRTIRVTWKKTGIANVFYNIYRSPNVINSKAALLKAVKLIIIKNGAEYYIDESLPYDGKYFYAVTTSFENGKENYNLIPKQNYTISPLVVGSENLHEISTYINTSLLSENKIKIKWKDAKSSKVKAYKIYRSDEIINSIAKLKKAQFLTNIGNGISQFIDNSPEIGPNFYALVSLFNNGKMSKSFISNRNFSAKAVVLAGTVKKKFKLTLLEAEKFSSNKIKIKWEYSGSSSENLNLHIYRTDEVAEDYTNLDEEQLIANVSLDNESYIDTVSDEGFYYYAALIYKNNSLISGKYLPGKSYTTEAIDISFSDDDENDNEIEEVEMKVTPSSQKDGMKKIKTIILDYYRKSDYKIAILKLKQIAKSSSYQHKTRSLAILYMGMCNYKLNRKRKALKLFLHKGVQTYYPKRGKFWYRKTLEEF